MWLVSGGAGILPQVADPRELRMSGRVPALSWSVGLEAW